MYRPKISLPVLATVDDGGPMVTYPAFAANLETAFLTDAFEPQKNPDLDTRRYRCVVSLANPFRDLSHFAQYLERLVYLRFPAVLTLFLLPGFRPRFLGSIPDA